MRQEDSRHFLSHLTIEQLLVSLFPIQVVELLSAEIRRRKHLLVGVSEPVEGGWVQELLGRELLVGCGLRMFLGADCWGEVAMWELEEG